MDSPHNYMLHGERWFQSHFAEPGKIIGVDPSKGYVAYVPPSVQAPAFDWRLWLYAAMAMALYCALATAWRTING